MTQRRQDLKRAQFLYSYEAPFGDTTCTYCGMEADTMDHVMPVSAAISLMEQIQGDRRRYRDALLMVPCCQNCNSLLGAKFFTCVSKKRQALAKILHRKHYRLLGAYDWDDDELAELKHTLRSYVAAVEHKRRTVEYRYAFARTAGRLR